jgi:hypothetical protein
MPKSAQAAEAGTQAFPHLLLLLCIMYAGAICIPIWMELFSH